MARTRWPAALLGMVLVAAFPSSVNAQSRVFEHLSVGDINGNLAASAEWKGASPDALRVIFGTDEPLVPGDGDADADVYERGPGGLVLLSGTQPGDAFFGGLSADASRVFFGTAGSLVAGDAGQRVDVYEASGGGLTLLSPGSANHDWSYAGNTPDGSQVFMHSTHEYVSDDDASSLDVFRRNPNGSIDYVSEVLDPDLSVFRGSSDDGSRVFFYVRGSIMHAIRVRTATNPVEEVSGDIFSELFLDWNGISADGTRALFTTDENLDPGETGSGRDIYERNSDGELRLISGGNYNPARFWAASADGDRVLFTTPARLTADDTDPPGPAPGMYQSYEDVYERRASGDLRLVSGGTGPFDAIFAKSTPEGTRAFFITQEPLLAASDQDTAEDVYERDAGGALRLVSGGSANVDAFYVGISGDGSHVFFVTTEGLVPEDVDGTNDVYARRADGSVVLMSSGTDGESVGFRASSTDGTRVILSAIARLAPTDTDDSTDLYASRPADPLPPGGSGPGNGAGTGTGDADAPLITSLLMRRAIRPRLNGGSVAQRRRRGGVVRYAISEAATTRFRVDRAAPGRRVGRRCRKPTRRNRTRRRCTRWVAKGSFTHQSVAGPNRFVFTGRVRGKRLRPGRYRLVAQATDAAGNRSAPRSRRFLVVR